MPKSVNRSSSARGGLSEDTERRYQKMKRQHEDEISMNSSCNALVQKTDDTSRGGWARHSNVSNMGGSAKRTPTKANSRDRKMTRRKHGKGVMNKSKEGTAQKLKRRKNAGGEEF